MNYVNRRAVLKMMPAAAGTLAALMTVNAPQAIAQQDDSAGSAPLVDGVVQAAGGDARRRKIIRPYSNIITEEDNGDDITLCFKWPLNSINSATMRAEWPAGTPALAARYSIKTGGMRAVRTRTTQFFFWTFGWGARALFCGCYPRKGVSARESGQFMRTYYLTYL